jgi:hypothetical protein
VALERLHQADTLQAVLEPSTLAVPAGEACGTITSTHLTAGSLDLAVRLLNHPTEPARHVFVADGGLVPASGGGGYDVHADHLGTTARNLRATLEALVARINAPGEGDPNKLDLDRTMVVLNTEFGRQGYAQGEGSTGTEHHPEGYVTALLGGPIGPDQAGILGAIGADGWADRYVTPAVAL